MEEMYQTKNNINTTIYDGLKVEKLKSGNACETLLIALEKAHNFPEHTAPRDALLVMIEGDINFRINNSVYRLHKHQHFSFPGTEKHEVFANENSKFLIIR